MLPLGCLPLWGSEGVTLITFPKEWKLTGFLQSQFLKSFYRSAGGFLMTQSVIFFTFSQGEILAWVPWQNVSKRFF